MFTYSKKYQEINKMDEIYCENLKCLYCVYVNQLNCCSKPEAFIGISEDGSCRKFTKRAPELLEIRFYNQKGDEQRVENIGAKGINAKLFTSQFNGLCKAAASLLGISIDELNFDLQTSFQGDNR
jgi:hypothetical protein